MVCNITQHVEQIKEMMVDCLSAAALVPSVLEITFTFQLHRLKSPNKRGVVGPTYKKYVVASLRAAWRMPIKTEMRNILQWIEKFRRINIPFV